MVSQSILDKYTGWDGTLLWEVLSAGRTADENAARAALEAWMPGIEAVLKQGATSPADFTLHDAEHSFRVAQRMGEIIPSDVLPRLSGYELALLLLSAYLHDIGMTPERNRVRSHRDYLLSGGDELLTGNERAILQEWLDDQGYGTMPPIAPDRPVEERVRLVDEIVTYYARHRHNDWSEEWIREKLSGESLGSYHGWVDDLVVLCRSHHEGYERLEEPRFDPRPVGSPPRTVHLRYLASVLRVADILDIDPERTPEVVLHHRDIAPGSVIYWYKDHQLSLKLEKARFSAFARPTRAYVQRAIEETVDGIEKELALVRRLDDTTHFEKPVGPGSDLPHRWELEPFVYRNVQPAEGAYEYIDGAFRPNTRRLLELLSGTELYGTPLAAVRELLQNAFDAVRELIAYQRLSQRNPADGSLEEILGNLHEVRLEVEVSGDRVWLVCRDTGIGMTKSIIKDHLLVSGSPRRHQVLELDRRCGRAGFSLGRTGQFGIGALSYFMLADRVEISTRRNSEARDEEPTGWKFESEGIGGFGELRRDTQIARGTEVRLRIRPELVPPGLLVWRIRLNKYLRQILRYLPCRFEFSPGEGEGEESLSLPPGWTSPEEVLGSDVVDTVDTMSHFTGGHTSNTDDGLSAKAREALDQNRSFWAAVRGEADALLRWESATGELPSEQGRYRIRIPFFALEGGDCLAFMRTVRGESGLEIRQIQECEFLSFPRKRVHASWRGIQINVDQLTRRTDFPAVVEVDFVREQIGRIAVNRGAIQLSEAGNEALRWLSDEVERLIAAFCQVRSRSEFGLFNARFSRIAPPTGVPFHWASDPVADDRPTRGDVRLPWGPVLLPATGLVSRAMRLGTGEVVAGEVPLHSGGSVEDRDLTWHSLSISPDRVAASGATWDASRKLGNVVYPLWTRVTGELEPKGSAGVCDFPPGWDRLCGIHWHRPYRLGNLIVWNKRNHVVQMLLGSGLPAFDGLVRGLTYPVDWTHVLRNKSAAASWMLGFLASNSQDKWDAITERDPHFFADLWSLVEESEPLYYLHDGFEPAFLTEVSPESYSKLEKMPEIASRLPRPEPEWCIEEWGPWSS